LGLAAVVPPPACGVLEPAIPLPPRPWLRPQARARHLSGARLLLAAVPGSPMLTLAATHHHHHRLPPALVGRRNCLLGRTTNSAIVSIWMELTDASFL